MQNPSDFCPALRENACGIAIVFLPHIGGPFLHGATLFPLTGAQI
jgi:HTH-type transcriptional regulator/antitoxin HigA